MKTYWKNLLWGALVSVPLVLTGCTSKCVDSFDCAEQAKKDGKVYQCVAGACVAKGNTGGGSGASGGGTGSTGGGSTSMGGGEGGGSGSAVDEEIAAVRAAADEITDGGAVDLTIEGALVTYVKPVVAAAGASDPAGFFIQGTKDGPALFVAIDPTTVTGGPFVAGDLVDLTVQTVKLSSGVHSVIAVTDASKRSSGNDVAALIVAVDEDNFDDAAVLDEYESRLISFSGNVTSDPVAAGAGYQAVNSSTTGTPDAGAKIRLRLPTALMAAQSFGPGCTFTLTGTPLWRFTSTAQPSAWDQSELTNIVCPAPAVIGANSISETSVRVNFSRDLASATVLPAAFTITATGGGDLAVSAATLTSPRSVTLTTDAQTNGTEYTVTVDDMVTDARGTALESAASTATFTGSGGASCSPPVVISAVFGANGMDNAFNQDFIELHNRGASAVNLAGWSLQYASAKGTNWASAAALTGTIAAGGYHLVAMFSSTGGTNLPIPDSLGATNISGVNGKIALVNSVASLPSEACPTADPSVVDFFGYGTADCFEGTVHPDLLNAGTTRNSNGCADSDVNADDFTPGVPPVPKNSASTTNICGCGLSGTGGGNGGGGGAGGGSGGGGGDTGGGTGGGSGGAAGGGDGGGSAGGGSGGGAGGGNPAVPLFGVLRVGPAADGGGLSNAAAQVHFEKRQLTDGGVVLDLPLPVATNGGNAAFTVAGSSTSEGVLNLSTDQVFAVATGYNSVPGIGNILSAPGVSRIVARIELSTNDIHTGTLISDSFVGSNIRSAATVDGTAYWVAGTSGSGNLDAGVRYVVHGSTGATADVYSGIQNMRTAAIYGGQLYGSTASGAEPDGGVSRVFAIGTGMPVSVTSTVSYFSGVNLKNPGNFVLLDQSNVINGYDTLYVAETATLGTGARKYTFDGTTWNEAAVFPIPSNDGAGYFVAAKPSDVPNTVAVLVTSKDGVLRWDDNGITGTAPAGSLITAAPPNTVFRGVVFLP